MYMVGMIRVLTSSMKNSAFQVGKLALKAFNMHSQLDTKRQQIYLNKLLKCIWSNEEKIQEDLQTHMKVISAVIDCVAQ